ncbi:phosphopyruvate hydratase [Tundrisphaera sp. TA3]|uniref:phosphopyruvate hydratase n=1 Tax=Tundrisphaera sp. TA3 TaxID=3435775 RepID=UPI003EBC50E9
MCRLEKLWAREVLDSRGSPTIEVEAIGEAGVRASAITSSGAGREPYAARELRDGESPRHNGRGVRRAVSLIGSEIGPALRGMDVEDQGAIDSALVELDGTPDKGRLGSNALMAVSLAVARAAALHRREEFHAHLNGLWKERLAPDEASEPSLPVPIVHMITGGCHAVRSLDFRDYLMIPVGARDFAEAVDMAASVYRSLGEILQSHGHAAHLIGPEGAYGPRLWANAQAVDHVLEAVMAAGLAIDRDVVIAIDVAATRLHAAGTSTYRLELGGEEHDNAGMIDLLEHWVRQYPIASIMDGLAEDDWDGWVRLTERLGSRVQLAGDDLYATQIERLRYGIDHHAGNAVVVKLNQAGTLSETLDAMALARRHGLCPIVSGRCGETEDSAIADLAVATACGLIKIGAPARSDRVSKYNRLLRIEGELGGSARYAGRSAFRHLAAG